MRFQIVISLLALVGAISGCSKKSTTFRQYKHDIASGYSFDPPLSRMCTEKRSDVVVLHDEKDTTVSNCVNIVPGLLKVQHGVSRFHFTSSPNDHPPIHDKVFHLTCFDSLDGTLKRYRNFSVPNEFKEIHSSPMSWTEGHLISNASLLEAFMNDLALRKPKNQYVIHLAEMEMKMNEDVKRAAFLSVTIQRFTYKMWTTLPITDALKSDFDNLPLNLNGKVNSYFHFIKKYGTHVRIGGTFGGYMFVLVSLSGEPHVNMNIGKAVESIVNDVLLMGNGQQIRHSIVKNGGFHGQRHDDVNSWASTLDYDPVPLSSNYLPIHSLLERDVVTKKSGNLETMTQFEIQVNELKKIMFELNSIRSSNKLATFVREVISNELNQICVSPELASAISEGLVNTNNIQFNNFGIKCTLKWYDGYDDVNIVSERQFLLIPNVCLTFTVPVKNGCDNLLFSLPIGVKCFIFFPEESCKSVSSRKFVKTADEMNKEFPNTRSMRLCSYEESKFISR